MVDRPQGPIASRGLGATPFLAVSRRIAPVSSRTVRSPARCSPCACLTCKTNVVIQRRIDDWKAWKIARQAKVELFDYPGEESSIDYGAVCTEKEFGRLLDERWFKDTAVICTNVWTALGAEKAMDKRGLKVGKAISVCALSDEMLAPWLSPTLTALRMPNTGPMLTKCFAWMISGGKSGRDRCF